MAPPTYSNFPLALLPTPKFETGKSDPFTIEASHMALSHNSFIRGFNTIYQQAPRLLPPNKQDFVGYCLAWHRCVAEHHHYEETEFFPAIDRAVGRTGVMEGAVEQHAKFHDGLARSATYLLEKGSGFSHTDLIPIMDSFSEALYLHLKEEPAQILALSRFDTPEKPIDIVAMALEAGKKLVTFGFVFNVLPVFLLNMETVEFEGGMWHNVFPPFGGVVRWLMYSAAPMWQQRRWQFASCGPDGGIKELAV